jgi:predicted ATPase
VASTRGKARGDNHAFLRSVVLLRERITDRSKYPFTIPAFRNLSTLALHPKVTFFVGENGAGKSTLLEAIAIAAGFNAEGGTKNFRFSTRPSESTLHQALRLVRGVRRARTGYFLRAESFFNVATEIERLDAEPFGGPPVGRSYGGRSLHEQSHGESFFALFMHRFGPEGLYILDEPEAALSPMRQLAFLRRVYELTENEGSQFIISTHSPFLMAYPRAKIYALSEAGIQPVEYEMTEHFQVARAFFGRREKLLKELFEGGTDE